MGAGSYKKSSKKSKGMFGKVMKGMPFEKEMKKKKKSKGKGKSKKPY